MKFSEIKGIPLITDQSQAKPVKVDSSGILQIFDTSQNTYRQFANVEDMKTVNNWELVKEIEVSGTVDELIEGLNGDIDEKYMIEFNLYGEYTGSGIMKLNAYWNEDTGENYHGNLLHAQDDGSIATDGVDFDSPTLIHFGGNNNGSVYGYAYLNAKSGNYRNIISHVRMQDSSFSDSAWYFVANSSWNNKTDNVTSLRLLSENVTNMTGYIKIYKWKSVRLATGYTYELIQRVDFNDEVCDFSIDVTGKEELFITYKIETSTLNTADEDRIFIYFNNDIDRSNYLKSYHWSNDGTGHGVTNVAGISICGWSTSKVLSSGIGFINLKGSEVVLNYVVKKDDNADAGYILSEIIRKLQEEVTTLTFKGYYDNQITGYIEIYELVEVSTSGGTGTGWTKWQTISSSQTLSESGNYLVDTSSGNVDITLPNSGDVEDFMCRIKNIGDNSVRIICQGTDKVDGNVDYTLSVKYESVGVGDNADGNFYLF